jgi:hypothetical protein
MPWKEFLKLFGKDRSTGFRFDRVLQYVTFPRVEVILKGPQADAEREAEEESGVRQVGPLGRKDMQYFFDWLYNKGVRHIIRVSVEDSGASGEKVHSDQAIQRSLERFTVEHLDWRKADLDPETIFRVSSKVAREPPSWKPKKAEVEPEIGENRQLRQLDLRWSGSNTVLRGWSEPEGLAMLPYLRKIRVFPPPTDKVRTLSFPLTCPALLLRVLTQRRCMTTRHGSTRKSWPFRPDSMKAKRLLGRLKSNRNLSRRPPGFLALEIPAACFILSRCASKIGPTRRVT